MSDLSAPLSRRLARSAKQPRRKGWRHLPVGRIVLAVIAVLLVAVVARIILVDTPNGGRPQAEVAINTKAAPPGVTGNQASSTGIDAMSVGPEIAPEDVAPALAAGTDIPPVKLAIEENAYGMLPDLVEESQYGAIPQMSGSGETPFAAYSRPSISATAAGNKSRVAIIVTGLGINVSGSVDAIAKLPDAITLAFAPYGKSLDRTVGAARAEGHEIYLEVPLEPFDYPDNDPGPDTLLTGQAPRDNMDKLYRVLGKFGGYAGLINNMGARFTSSGSDFGPMMEELGARGLGYIDDGSSNRSLAAQLATANRVPFARASLLLDGNPARAPILDQLTALEDLARTNGSAIGVISALPISVQTIVEWANDAESRGIVIVPASALMTK